MLTTGKAQPALLYIVPTMLGVTSLAAWMRKELAEFWNYDEHRFFAELKGKSDE